MLCYCVTTAWIAIKIITLLKAHFFDSRDSVHDNHVLHHIDCKVLDNEPTIVETNYVVINVL